MVNRPTLDELANRHQTDKGTQYGGPSKHGYAPSYDNILSQWRDEPIRMLEIGVCMEYTGGGQSINMWVEYFEKAKIYTFDIVDMSQHPSITGNERVTFFRGDQSNRDDFKLMHTEFGNTDFDVILEDGSHIHEHQIISLGHLFQYVKPGGYYILEDISIPGHEVCCIRNDETYNVLTSYLKNGKFNTPYLTKEEAEYLKNNIQSIDMVVDVQDAYITAIIHKK